MFKKRTPVEGCLSSLSTHLNVNADRLITDKRLDYLHTTFWVGQAADPHTTYYLFNDFSKTLKEYDFTRVVPNE